MTTPFFPILSHFLPGPSRRLAPVITCNAFLCFQSYIVTDISLTEIYRWLVTFIKILSAILKSTSRGMYTCQLSRLRVENFDLTPAHACGPISHAWLKNVSCCRLTWHNFQKYVNSDPCKARKPCVKWINDNTFLTIPDFWSEKHWERDRVYTRPKTGTR